MRCKMGQGLVTPLFCSVFRSMDKRNKEKKLGMEECRLILKPLYGLGNGLCNKNYSFRVGRINYEGCNMAERYWQHFFILD